MFSYRMWNKSNKNLMTAYRSTIIMKQKISNSNERLQALMQVLYMNISVS